MARNVPFETLSRREVAALRRDSQEPYTLIGYEDTEGRALGLLGDAVGPYVQMVGRAALDGESATPDIPAVAQGESQRILVDAYGRIWANVTVNIPPTEVQNVQGNIASGDPDAGSYPVKVGGFAVAANTGLPAPVTAGDRVDAAYDLSGRQIVVAVPDTTVAQRVEGNIASDDPDGTSYPVKVGGRAVATPSTGLAAAVAADDRVDAAYDRNGRQIVLASGDTAADAVDAGNPVKVGGAAADPTTGLAAVALADRVNLALDVSGRIIALAQGNVAAGVADAGNPLKTGGVAADPTTGLGAVALGQRSNLALDISGRGIVLAQGNVASDAVNAGNPVLIGGVAYTTAPATPVSADADRVSATFDRYGRQQMSLPQSLAGENLILNSIRTVRAKLAVQQESWQNFRLDNVTGAVVKNGPGRIARLCIVNTSATALYVIVHDSTTFTVLGTIIWEGFVPAAAGGIPGVYEDDWESSDGLFCPVGISVVTSTGVAAIAGSVQIYGNALYY